MRKVVLRSSTFFNGEVDHDNFIKGKGKGGPKRPPDGVHFDAGKHKWVAVLDVGKTRLGLGVFDTEAKAQAAYDKELKNAKKLGWGASDNVDPKSCPGWVGR
jgi:hypothetical protein